MNFKYTPNTLNKMEQLFEECNYLVRYEKGNFHSGYCVLEHRKIVVINKFLNTEGRINALLEITPTLLVNEPSLSSEMLKWYHLIKNNDLQQNTAINLEQSKMDL